MDNEKLVALIQAGVDVKKNLELLYLQNIGLIRTWAYPYAGTVEMEDLLQEAYFGLVKAAEEYNPELGFKFTTFAYWKVLSSIVRYSQNNRYLKRIPAYMLELMSKYHKFKKLYLKETGEEPSDSDYMEYLEINNKQLKELKKQIAEINCIPIETPIMEGKTLAETLSDNFDLEMDIVERLTYKQLADGLWKAVNKLEKIQREIIVERYKHKKTLEKIAEEKNLSGARVEQIEKKALHLLAMQQEVKDMAEYYGYDCRLAYRYGFERFKDTMTSSTELIALKNIEIQEHLSKITGLLDELVNY